MKYLSFVGNILALLAVAFFLYLSYLDRHIFQYVMLDESSSRTMLLVIILYTSAIFLGAIVWFFLLQATKEKVKFLSAVRIFFLSQSAKYIPGNVAHQIGRAVLAKRHGIRMTNALFTMFMETFLIIGIAALLALAALSTVGEKVFDQVPNLPQSWILVILSIVALTAPIAGHHAFVWVARWWARYRNIEYQSVHIPSFYTFFLACLLYIINYLILGMVLQLIAAGIFGADWENVLLLSGIFSIAWVVGFITPGAPAGLGVREVVLVAGLSPLYSHEMAIGITIVLRLVTVLGDGLIFLIGIALSKSSFTRRTFI